MMVMTAKLDLKKVMLVLAGAAALVLSLILLLGGGKEDTQAAALSDNDKRVKFLTDFGWEVTPSPRESSQVKIPEQTSELYERYTTLQKSQGYDLTDYAGKKVLRYVYEIRNYPGAEAPVYATVLMCRNRIIGGDVTVSGPRGKVRTFAMPREQQPAPPPAAPAETTAPSATLPHS